MVYRKGKPASVCTSAILIILATSLFEGALAGSAANSASSPEHVERKRVIRVANYKLHEPNGFYTGTIILPTTISDFENPQRHGHGTFIYGDYNASYTGGFQYNLEHGYGKYLSRIIEYNFSYEGDFRNGEYDGYGILEQQEFRYAGEFKASKRHGRGRMERLIDGIPILNVGDFRNDNFHNGTEMFKNNGTVIQKANSKGTKLLMDM